MVGNTNGHLKWSAYGQHIFHQTNIRFCTTVLETYFMICGRVDVMLHAAVARAMSRSTTRMLVNIASSIYVLFFRRGRARIKLPICFGMCYELYIRNSCHTIVVFCVAVLWGKFITHRQRMQLSTMHWMYSYLSLSRHLFTRATSKIPKEPLSNVRGIEWTLSACF